MISRAQQILIKRAQKEAGLDDAEYREALQAVAGLRSSTDRAMTDHHVDTVLGYFEAIFWRKVDSGVLQPACKGDSVFRQRGHWKSKNCSGETSRDRYVSSAVSSEISQLESELGKLGFGAAYCAGIRHRAIQDATDLPSLHVYKAALRRTLSAKQKANLAVREPATADTNLTV
jgi:hypothetical protein